MFGKSVAGLASLLLLGGGALAAEDGLPNPENRWNELQQVSTETVTKDELGGGAAETANEAARLAAEQREQEAQAWRDYNQQQFLRQVWTYP